MIKLNAGKSHTILLPNTNKALAEALKGAAAEQFAQLSQAKDLSSLLEGLFKGSVSDDMQNKALLELLKNNPTFKELGSIKTTMQELLGVLKQNNMEPQLQKTLHHLLQNIKDIDPKTLQNKLQDSGIFLESKLKNGFDITNDLKAQVLKASSHHQLPQLDKLALQLDYYQLLSHLNNASVLYIPYSFDSLQEGSLNIKKAKQNSYFCDIDLELKEHGALHVRLGLFDTKQLSINIKCESKTLQQTLQANIQKLRKKLTDAGITLQDVRFLDEKTQPYGDATHDIALGFEAKV